MMPLGWIISLVLIALVLIAVDLYLPGFVLGSIGIVLMLTALAVCYQNFGLSWTCALFLAETLLGIGAAYASMQIAPRTSLGRKMILFHQQTAARAGTEPPPELVGKQGVAQSLLRPSGVAVIDGKRLDVTAESGIIERGSAVKVVAIEGTRILVRKL
jgi:membrane-bound ClpP family serine protease